MIIKEHKEQRVNLFGPDEVVYFVNYLELLEAQILIAEGSLSGYYVILRDEKININSNGELEKWPKGLSAIGKLKAEITETNELFAKLYKIRKKKLEEKKNEFFEPNMEELTNDWLISTFYDISEDIMNGESMEDIVISETKDNFIIKFTLNCDRYGFYKNQEIKINKAKKKVSVNVDDTPIEGCGIEQELSERIIELIY